MFFTLCTKMNLNADDAQKLVDAFVSTSGNLYQNLSQDLKELFDRYYEDISLYVELSGLEMVEAAQERIVSVYDMSEDEMLILFEIHQGNGSIPCGMVNNPKNKPAARALYDAGIIIQQNGRFFLAGNVTVVAPWNNQDVHPASATTKLTPEDCSRYSEISYKYPSLF